MEKKQHFEILDGLRGVAALVVLVFHVFEVFAGGDHKKLMFNHGYLAVDFFFLLSGFVIAHAYDNRWNTMSLADFAKRRLIRLHPMIIIGMLVGAVLFYFAAAPMFPFIENTPIWTMLGMMLIGFFLIPVPISWDIRGWTEMYPVNGPAWSLFYEYIANILYALILRKLSNTILFILMFIAGGALIHLAVTSPNGDIIGGWAISPEQIRIGLTRLMFPFLAGILLRRYFKPTSIKNAFLLTSILLTIFLVFPRVGGETQVWLNGIYDSGIVIFIFPIIVYLGASGKIEGQFSNKVCKFLGDISYPLYITHYPIVYVFYGWVNRNNISLADSIPMAILTIIISISFAYLALKVYDTPVRKWLTERYLVKK